MKTQTISIVDNGRGPQLSTTRITVLDIFSYLHRGYDVDTILEIIPTLSREEIDVVVEFVNAHSEETGGDGPASGRSSFSRGTPSKRQKDCVSISTNRFRWTNGSTGYGRNCGGGLRRKTVKGILADSLEATIRKHNTANSLPVFTIADLNNFRKSGLYAERVLVRVYEYLREIGTVACSTGRLFLP